MTEPSGDTVTNAEWSGCVGLSVFVRSILGGLAQ